MTKSSNAGFDPRELQRREFQEAAAQAIDRQAAAIQQTREFMADLSTRIDALKAEQAALSQGISALYAWRERRVFGRLRWLLTGR